VTRLEVSGRVMLFLLVVPWTAALGVRFTSEVGEVVNDQIPLINSEIQAGNVQFSLGCEVAQLVFEDGFEG
jgi:hypothetical protein